MSFVDEKEKKGEIERPVIFSGQRPGLYAVYSLLRQLYIAPGGLKDLAVVSNLRNRSSLQNYLSLLESLGWLTKKTIEFPSGSLRGALQHKWLKKQVFEITDLGRAFYEQFPLDFDVDTAKTKIMKRPSLIAIQRILETIAEQDKDEGVHFATFSYLCHRGEYDTWAVVGNRNNCIKYLKLLHEQLRWVEKKLGADYGRSEYYYDLTGEGKVACQSLRALRI
jgi:hypothetical protein